MHSKIFFKQSTKIPILTVKTLNGFPFFFFCTSTIRFQEKLLKNIVVGFENISKFGLKWKINSVASYY